MGQYPKKQFVNWVEEFGRYTVDYDNAPINSESNPRKHHNMGMWREASTAVSGAFLKRAGSSKGQAYLEDAINDFKENSSGYLKPAFKNQPNSTDRGVPVDELNRNSSLFYTLYGMNAMTTLADVAERNAGTDLYRYRNSSGQSLNGAYKYLSQFLEGDKTINWVKLGGNPSATKHHSSSVSYAQPAQDYQCRWWKNGKVYTGKQYETANDATLANKSGSLDCSRSSSGNVIKKIKREHISVFLLADLQCGAGSYKSVLDAWGEGSSRRYFGEEYIMQGRSLTHAASLKANKIYDDCSSEPPAETASAPVITEDTNQTNEPKSCSESTPSKDPSNLLPNPYFEDRNPVGSSGNYTTHGSSNYSWATDQCYSGSHSLKNVSSGSSSSLTRFFSKINVVKAKPNTKYTGTAWVKTNGLSAKGEKAGINLTWKDSTGKYQGGGLSKAVTGNSGWTKVTASITTPSNATNIRLEMRSYGSGTVWWDNVSLKEVSTSTSNSTSTDRPTSTSTSLFTNTDFESTNPIGSNGIYWTHGASNYAWSTDEYHSSNHSLRNISSGSYKDLTRFLTRINEVSAVPNATYKAVAWVKVKDLTSYKERSFLTITWKDVNDVYKVGGSSSTVSGNTGWVKLTTTAKMPSNVENVRVELRTYGSGTSWWDDVTLEKL